MKQEALFKLSLAFSIAGIFLLLLLSNTLEPRLIIINEINNKMLNEKVKISGKIEKIEDKETFQIISLKDETGKIDILCECISSLQENENLEVIGRVQDYKGNLQIQADKIIKK